MTVTFDELTSLLSYDPITGEFRRMKSYGRFLAGSKVGSITDRGYVRISVASVEYRAHRLAWMFVYGEFPNSEIDHIDNNRSNNAIKNLRLATRSENLQNRIFPGSKNKSGALGVSWHKQRAKWRASITVNKRQVHLGLFKNIEDAHFAYKEAKRQLHPFSDQQFEEMYGRSELELLAIVKNKLGVN